ncbi:MAG: beta-ketoacyl-[acyl-carrier-protein] synthase II [Spirochaetaceae bacterium]|nr:MAG: beta-ketoacyl-[acyl-carrier-protein] synthase II [Spirochaetaceae bacterium]
MNNERRVVVTGIGTVNPLGKSVKETWEKVRVGKSGISNITKFDASNFSSKVAGEVTDFDYKALYSEENAKTAKRLESFVHYAEAGLQEALGQSRLEIAKEPERVGICIGSGIGGIHSQLENSEALITKGNRRVSPFFIPATIGNIASGFLSIVHGIMGPNLSMQTACATANHSIGTALMLIKYNMADAMIAGGTEGTIMPLSFAGFCNMHALSTHFNDEPTRSSRPFDKDRDGFIMSEGSGILVLEEYEHAKKRGADILCEVLAVGMSGDAYDLTSPEPEGKGAIQSMRQALKLAGLTGKDINYVNAHGTSTIVGDVAECKAIAEILEGNTENICVGSTKSFHGHLLGATAGLEAILCIKVMEEGLVPPNINIDNLDPGITLTCINREPLKMAVNVALSNSFGFGGHNSSLLLKKL